MVLLMIGAAMAGALGRRIAGGLGTQWTGIQGTQWQRVVWGLIMAGIAAAAGLWWPYALGYGATIWVGSSAVGYAFPGEGSSGAGGLNMGRVPAIVNGAPSMAVASTGRWLHDAVRVLYHGLGGMLLGTLGAWWLGHHWWWLAAAGAACPVAYEVGWRVTLPAGWLGCPVTPNWPGTGAPLGELIWGAALGVATVATVI